MSAADCLPTIFLVDTDAQLRGRLGRHLKRAGFQVREYGSGFDFLDECDASASACAVLEACLPGLGGLEVHAELLRRGLTLPVILMSGRSNVALAVQALKRGVWDFLEKPLDLEVLVAQVQVALAEHGDRRVRGRPAQLALRLPKLTPRERELMRRLVSGEPGKMIAAECGISPRTVDVHRARILRKLGVPSLIQLAVAMAQWWAWTDSSGLGCL